jgi:type IV secretory pathway VirD2 relaxase
MGHEDDLTHFRPRIGRRLRARDRVAASPVRIAVLVRRGHGRAFGSRQLPSSGGFGPRPNARRVLIKAHVQRLTARGAQAAARHLRYIERDGVEKDGSPGVLYGPDGRVSRGRFEQPRLGEQHQFRFIVSPEDGADLELTGYVRELMRRVERDLGRPVEWAAVNHHDTEHPHAHVVVRGVDLEGRPLRIDRAYIARGLRWSAQELATEMLGPRLEREVRRVQEREVTRERFTSLDRDIAGAAVDRRVDVAGIAPRRGAPERDVLLRRLERLRDFGLAQPSTNGAWVLAERWDTDLRERGERGDILKQMHRAMSGVDPDRLHLLRPGQGLPDGRGGVDERPLVGRVVRVGLMDEHKGAFYALVETPRGEAYQVPLSAGAMDSLRAGDVVSLQTRRRVAVQPLDRQIAEVARSQGGVFAITENTGAAAEGKAAAARLHALERQGVVAAQGPRAWHVPADFLERLEALNRGSPARYRLSIQPSSLSLAAQVRHAGPVWLDTVEPVSLSKAGFGADVATALTGRRQHLRALGVDPDSPQRDGQLRDLERRAVGKEIAARSGRHFLDPPPARFRGVVEQGSQDGRYVAVSDGVRFVLLRASPQWRALQGQSVEVAHHAQGPFIVRRARDRDRDLGR